MQICVALFSPEKHSLEKEEKNTDTVLRMLCFFCFRQKLQESLEEQQTQVNSLTHMVVVVDESSPENGMFPDFIYFLGNLIKLLHLELSSYALDTLFFVIIFHWF